MTEEKLRQWRRKYNTQQNFAGLRKIEWKFTFEEWLQWWINTGKLAERGRGKGKYVMARFGDTGPYSIDNVKCITTEENNREAHVGNKNLLGHKHSDKSKQQMSVSSKGKKKSPEHCANIAAGSRHLPPSEETILASIEAHSKRCLAEDIEYSSGAAASKALGIDRTTVYSRIRKDKPGYKWLD